MLMIEQRANGQSEGAWATFGAREQFDVLDWLSWIRDHNDSGLPVYLYGTSMGGATVLMASRYLASGAVAGIIADAAFTSMEEVVFASLKRRIRVFPVRTARWIMAHKCSRKAGFDIAAADAEKALRHCVTPVLFIHGTADERVPVEQSRRNFQACACDDKELLIVENANHVCSWFEDPDRYISALADFFKRHDKKSG